VLWRTARPPPKPKDMHADALSSLIPCEDGEAKPGAIRLDRELDRLVRLDVQLFGQLLVAREVVAHEL
jgi:hypothetical protein